MDSKRISQLRRSKGMSQEALGSELGVSRQAISKWESERAMPEVEKLIAMSRLFGVPVGYLLGIEEKSEEKSCASGTDDTVQNSTACDSVIEETVLKYLAALPGEKNHKIRPWAIIAAVVFTTALITAMAATYISLNEKITILKTQYSAIERKLSGVTASVSQQVGSMTGKIEEILNSQDSLLSSYDCRIADYDPQSNQVTFAVSAVPKTVPDGLSAEFIVRSGDERHSFPGEYDGYGSFQASAACIVTDDISISVAFFSNGVRENQTLASYKSLPGLVLPHFILSFDDAVLIHANTRDSLGNPVTIDEFQLFVQEYEKDSHDAELSKLIPADIAAVGGYILINGERVCTAELITGEGSENSLSPAKPIGFKNIYQLIFRDFVLSAEPSDEILIILEITDTYDRSYTQCAASYVVDPSGYLEESSDIDDKTITPLP